MIWLLDYCMVVETFTYLCTCYFFIDNSYSVICVYDRYLVFGLSLFRLDSDLVLPSMHTSVNDLQI